MAVHAIIKATRNATSRAMSNNPTLQQAKKRAQWRKDKAKIRRDHLLYGVARVGTKNGAGVEFISVEEWKERRNQNRRILRAFARMRKMLAAELA